MNFARVLCSLALLPLALAAPSASSQTKVDAEPFGNLPSGEAVTAYTLSDAQLTVRVATFGAHILSIDAPDRSGQKADVVLGYNSLAGYLSDNKTYMGSIPGRYANRIGNAQFQLDGKTYKLSANEHGNLLHGGATGFDRLNWTGKKIPSGVELTLISKDGDQGFPGTLTAHVRYTLVGDKLRMDYSATTDKPTVVNLTNHSYFNLSGAGSGAILNEVMMIRAAEYTPVNAKLIPTGRLAPVAGTPFDFNQPTPIGARIHDDHPQLKIAGGYDHNYVLDKPRDLNTPAAVVTDPASGRELRVFTTEPGVQFYSGNSLDGSFHAPSGGAYARFTGFCLETQHYPDSPNQPSFPSTTLRPGQTYRSSTVFEFTVQR